MKNSNYPIIESELNDGYKASDFSIAQSAKSDPIAQAENMMRMLAVAKALCSYDVYDKILSASNYEACHLKAKQKKNYCKWSACKNT